MKKTKSKKEPYFGIDVQNHIIKYNELSEIDPTKANKLFQDEIYNSFMKLAENVINTWKIRKFETTFQDLQTEVVAFMYSKMDGYDPKVGKAYSYFTIICRNYLFAKSKKIKKHRDSKVDTEYIDIDRDIDAEYTYQDYQETLSEFLGMWCNWYLENFKYIHTNSQDAKIAESVIDILKSHSELDIYNKKLLYVLIRERTGIKTQYITKVVKVIKSIFYDLFNEYNTTGEFAGDQYLLEKGYKNKFFKM